LFAGHPLGAPVVGTQESIGAISRDAIASARERLWRANNLVLTVVGNMPPDEVLARAQRFFGPLPAGEKNQRPTIRLEPKNLPATVRGEAGQQQTQFRVGFAAPAQRDRDSYPFILLDFIMSGSSGLIFRELRSERGLAYVAGSAYMAYQDAGTWFATAGVDPQNLEAALDVTLSVIRVVREFRVRDTDLTGLRSQIEGQRALEDETNAARAERLANQEVLGEESTAELVARLSEVTPADLQRVAREYLQPERALTAIVGPARGG
jgi:predicted Zn-dependent peptidase